MIPRADDSVRRSSARGRSAATDEQPDPGYREQGDDNHEDAQGAVCEVRAIAQHEATDHEERDEDQCYAGSKAASHAPSVRAADNGSLKRDSGRRALLSAAIASRLAHEARRMPVERVLVGGTSAARLADVLADQVNLAACLFAVEAFLASDRLDVS